MGNMDQHPHSCGESRSVANHPVPSVEAEMTNQMDQEVEEARRKVWWQRHPREEYGSCSDCAEEIDALIEAVRRQERERVYAEEDERVNREMRAMSDRAMNLLRACSSEEAEAAEERIRELEAELSGTVETYTETTGDMGAEILELRAENERLREFIRFWAGGVGGQAVKSQYMSEFRDAANSALATPPASTEDDGTQVPE